jgi:hypothetical protein
MAVEGLTIAAVKTLDQERILISENTTLNNLETIIKQEFNVGELIEVQLLDYTPSLFGQSFMPETIRQRNNLSKVVTTQINRFVKGGAFEVAQFPTLTLWPGDIPFAGYAQNNLFLRWAAKTAEVDFEGQILQMLSEIQIDVSPTGAPTILDPITEWQFGEINIYRYTNRGADIINREIREQEGFFERVWEGFQGISGGIGRALQSDVGGIPTIFILAAGIIIIPEVTKTIREFRPRE